MLKEFPNLFNPRNNYKSIDYINDWIKDVNAYIIKNDVTVSSLEEWSNTVKETYGLEQLIDLKAQVENFTKLNISEENILDLTKMVKVLDTYTFDDQYNIVKSNITIGDPEEEEDIPGVVCYTNDGIARKGISFNCSKNEYLSGEGSWCSLPDIPTSYIKNVTREYLLSLMNDECLTPGMYYRIIDYSTIVMQEGVSSNNIGIDIIVKAISENELDENVTFTYGNSTNQLKDAGVNIHAWKGKYCIYNDFHRFSFVNPHKSFIIVNIDNIPTHYVRDEEYDIQDGEKVRHAWRNVPDVFKAKKELETFDSISYFPDGDNIFVYTETDYPVSVIDVDNPVYGYSGVQYGYQESPSTSVLTETGVAIPGSYIISFYPVSKGVIYYMEDEHNNSAPYDFKSIVFYWDEDNIHGHTFTNIEDDRDASIYRDYDVYGNKIEEYFTTFIDNSGQKYQRLTLNKMSMNSPCIGNKYGVGSHDTFILGHSKNNTWLGESAYNKFHCDVQGNLFQIECSNNTIKIPVRGNICMGKFSNNDFDILEYTATTPEEFTKGLCYNTINAEFSNNKITMPIIANNIIGGQFKNNTLNGYVGVYNTGSTTYQNALYLDAEHNFVNCVIGNGIENNTFNGLQYTTIGNTFKNNSSKCLSYCTINSSIENVVFKEICEGMILEGNNKNIVSNIPIINSTLSHGIKNIIIEGVSSGMKNSVILRNVSGEKPVDSVIITVRDVDNDYPITYSTGTNKEILV